MKNQAINAVKWDISTFLFALLIVLSSNTYAFDVGGFKVKWSQVALIVYCVFNFFMIIRLFYGKTGIVDRFTNFALFSIIAYAIFSMSYTLDIGLTLKTLVLIIFNVLAFYVVVASLRYRALLYNNMRKVTIMLFWLFVLLTTIHYFLGFYVPEFRTPMNTIGALFGGIKASVFFNESNWHCNYMFFLYFTIYLFYRKGYVKRKVMNRVVLGMFIVSMICLSRVCFLIFIVHFIFYYLGVNKKLLVVFILGGVLFYYSPIPKMLLPERYTVDLYDHDVNIRYIDSSFLIEEVGKYKRTTIGMGLGTLAVVNKYNRYRSADDEFSGTTINILPVQLYFDYGLLGLLFFSAIFLWGIIRTKNEDTRFILIASFIFCSFHMPGYMTFFWVFMGYFYYLLNVLPLRKHKYRIC